MRAYSSFLLALIAVHARAAVAPQPPPLFQSYCIECHGGNKPKAGLNVEALLAKPSISAQAERWEKMEPIFIYFNGLSKCFNKFLLQGIGEGQVDLLAQHCPNQ